jgi:hypothetical protein
MRRFARFVCLSLGTAGGLALAGCGPTGNYELSWNFFPRADGTGEPQGAGDGCGLHGVDAIFIQGTSSGAGATRIALCTATTNGSPPGHVSGFVAPGDWTFSLQSMDVRGTLVGDPVSTMTLTVSQGGPTAVFPTVTITPRPECSDGVDNDGDGLVDLDDPGCAGFDKNNPHDTTLESSAGPGSGLDAGASTDAATADGATADGMTPDAPADGPDLDGAAADAGSVDAGVPDDAAAGD